MKTTSILRSCRYVSSRLLVVVLAWALPSYAEADTKDVTIAVSSTSFVLGGARIAENAGLFEKSGIHAHIIIMDSGNAAMSALIGKSAQFTVAGPSEALAARVRGQDIVIIANLYRGLAGSVVLSKTSAETAKIKPDASVADRLKALDGLVIAVPSATSALLAPIRKGAEEAGAKIKFTYMSQPAMVAALESGAIQGMIASYPFAGAPVLRGTGVVWINGPKGELPDDALPTSSASLQTTADYAKANGDVVQKLRKSFDDTATLILEHPDAAKAALTKGYAQLKPEEIDLAFSDQKANWTKPVFSTADIAHEIELLKESANLPGLETIDPAAVLVKSP